MLGVYDAGQVTALHQPVEKYVPNADTHSMKPYEVVQQLLDQALSLEMS